MYYGFDKVKVRAIEMSVLFYFCNKSEGFSGKVKLSEK